MADQNNKALNKAVAMLTRRALSAEEVRMRLKDQGFDKLVVENCINYLLERGYLDDAALCSMLFRKFSHSGDLSKRALIFKLRRRGIEPALIQKVMDEEYDSTEEWRQALRVLNKQLGRRRALDWDQVKLLRYLATRGFSPAAAAKAVRHCLDTLSKNLYNYSD